MKAMKAIKAKEGSDKIIDYTLEEFLGYNKGLIKESEELLVLGKFKFTFDFDITSYFMQICALSSLKSSIPWPLGLLASWHAALYHL